MIKNTAIICLSPNAGGMEMDAIKLAQKLSIHSQITLICKKDHFVATQYLNYVSEEDIQLKTIKFQSNFSLSIIKHARNIIEKNNITNVIFFGASELKSLYFAFLGKNINLIVRHGTTKSRAKKDWFHRLIYKNVSTHVSICKHLQKNVRYIIPFGTSSQEFLIYPSFTFKEPKTNKQKKLTILHIGRIAKGKGQLDAIKACNILIQNNIDFQLNLVGKIEESYKKEFLSIYTNCSYKNKINLIGFTNDINQYIENSDIFLFPSHGEGFGNSLIEAMSNNIIALTYSNTSFPEFKKMGLYFHLVEDKNIHALSKQLLFIIQNLEEEKNKSIGNYSLLKKLFSLENEINNYLKILQ